MCRIYVYATVTLLIKATYLLTQYNFLQMDAAMAKKYAKASPKKKKKTNGS